MRDFQKKLVYWAFPSEDANKTFPNRVLVYNYEDNNFAFFKDSFTCFGTWQKTLDYTWATLNQSWAETNWAWNSAIGQSFFPSIVAGNQVGQVHIAYEQTYNDPSLDLMISIGIPNSISNAAPAVFQVTNHNLEVGQIVTFKWTQAFGVNVVNEAAGTAPAGTVAFTASLANIGVFPATITATIGANTYTDLGDGTLAGGAGGSSVNYETGRLRLNFAALGADTPVLVSYTYNLLNFQRFEVASITANTFTLSTLFADGSKANVNFDAFGAPYTGTGEVAIINGFRAMTKRFTPFANEDVALRINLADLILTRSSGEFEMNVFVDSEDSTPAVTFPVSTRYAGFSLTPRNKIFQKVYVNSVGSFVQLEMKLDGYANTLSENFSSQWELHGMTLTIEPAGRLL